MFIKRLIKNIQILRWIKDSKKVFQEYNNLGMCQAFVLSTLRPQTFKRGTVIEEWVTKYIPEYTRENFGISDNYSPYWWDIHDKHSRIKAFDKLISIYKKKLGFISKFF